VNAKLRASIRDSTQCTDEQLDALVGELEAKIEEIVNVGQKRPFDYPTKAAQQYEDTAAALRTLIAVLERVHPAVRDGIGLSTDELIRRFKLADAMATALQKDVRVGRPVVERLYRDGLARTATRIIGAHCSEISRANLRRAIAAVLETAHYKFPDPKKDGAKFDRMSETFPLDRIDEAERVAKELEERLPDVPI
jgi:hypothetical protein